MSTSYVTLRFRDGSIPVGKKVILSFNGAQTSPAFTDSRGTAAVQHSSSGNATVYVDGRSVGVMRALGSESFLI
ncbi:MAG: hypothetical protein R3B84_19760 [Zavarzinella sp.]